jgi:hypothetical protein
MAERTARVPRHASLAERTAQGRAARTAAPRQDLAAHTPPAQRDPVQALVDQAATRQQDLLPIRYGRMSASPFAFLRRRGGSGRPRGIHVPHLDSAVRGGAQPRHLVRLSGRRGPRRRQNQPKEPRPARKVVGVGSVGTRCFMALMLGRDENDALVLPLKEANASVLEPYVGRSAYRHRGARVVLGQRLVQVSSDLFLGWNTRKDLGRHYYWPQLKDMKASAELSLLRPKQFTDYVDTCRGASPTRTHAPATR